MKVVAVLSTTILPIDGTYSRKGVALTPELIKELQGVLHYIGHPDTRRIVEELGAVKAASNLFTGFNIGETAVCFPIQQGKSTRAVDGFTSHQSVELSDLSVVLITRMKDICLCGQEMPHRHSPTMEKYL